MLIYWALFAYFAIGALVDGRLEPDLRRRRPFWLLGGIFIAVMVGFRYKVGADWKTYDFIFHRASELTFAKATDIGDPGYQAVNWAVGQLGGEVVWVNVVCALLFTWGLFRLARVQPYPWLAVLLAVPYMVIVVSSYTRQAAALGLIMAGLAAIIRGGSLGRFAIYVVLAAAFHRTAIVVLPLVIFSRPRNRFLNIVGGALLALALYDFFLADSMDTFVSAYIKTKYSSQGAAIRIAMEIVAAAAFLVCRRDLGFSKSEDRLWFYFSLAAFAALLALLVTPSSTAVDRLSIYLMPIQVVVLSRLPLVFSRREFSTALLAGYSFAIEFVWLMFATHAQYWVPYRFYPL